MQPETMQTSALDERGKKELQPIMNVAVIALIAIILVAAIAQTLTSTLKMDLPLYAQGIIVGIALLAMYAVKDHVKRIVDGYKSE